MNRLTRRDFLKLAMRSLLAGSGLLGLGMLVRYLGYQGGRLPQTEFDIGVVDNFPLGSHTRLVSPPAMLLHTESGFSALSLICTHLGCTLEQQGDGYACPCHGSRFAGDGQVQKGPAVKPMTVFRVEVNQAGHVILFTNQERAIP
jgi:cytochrome b6-f complex iron-sulfur subunit